MLGLARLAHEPDAPHLARELAQAPADLDAVAAEQRAADLEVVDAVGNRDDRDLGEAVALRHDQREAQRLESGPQRRRVPGVAVGPRLGALLDDDLQRLPEAEKHADRRGVVVHVLLAPVVADQPEVEVPGRRRGGSVRDRLLGARADRRRREARRAGQALLGGGVAVVDPVAVHGHLGASQGGDRVDHEQRVVRFRQARQVAQRLENACGGLRLDDGDHLDSGAACPAPPRASRPGTGAPSRC